MHTGHKIRQAIAIFVTTHNAPAKRDGSKRASRRADV